jgi:hypothetical protein
MDVFPEAWRPSPGDSIEGAVTDLAVRDGGEYEPYPIVTLDTNGGTAIHCFHEVLRNELARRSPKLGDRLKIDYHGVHAVKGYHVYAVSSDGDLPFSWDRFGGPPGDGPDGDTPDETDGGEDLPF